VYVIHPGETIAWAFAFSDKEIITWAHVHGEFQFNTIPGDWIYGQVTESKNFIKRFGIRAIHVSNPNIRHPAAARTYARTLLKRVNANMITGSVTIVLRPEIQLARNVFIPWLNLVGYIAGIDHNVHWGRTAATTLSLKYVRHPWEPWSPIEYKASEEETQRWTYRSEREKYTRASTLDRENTYTKGHTSEFEMKSYVRDAYVGAYKKVLYSLNAICTITKGLDLDGSEYWRNGLALKVTLNTMEKPNVPGVGYEKAATAANLNTVISAFRASGFRVVNNYRSRARWETGDTEGHLVLYYNKPPSADRIV